VANAKKKNGNCLKQKLSNLIGPKKFFFQQQDARRECGFCCCQLSRNVWQSKSWPDHTTNDSKPVA